MKLSDFLKTYYGIPEAHKNKRLRYLCEGAKNFPRTVLEEYINPDELVISVDQSKICELFKYNRREVLDFLYLGYCFYNQRDKRRLIDIIFKKNIWYKNVNLELLTSYLRFDDFISLYSSDKLLYYFFKDPIIINTGYRLLPLKDRGVDINDINDCSDLKRWEKIISVNRFNRILEKQGQKERRRFGKYFIYHEKNTRLPEKAFFKKNGYGFIDERW